MDGVIQRMKKIRGMLDDTYRDSKTWLFFAELAETILLKIFKHHNENTVFAIELKKEINRLKPMKMTDSEANNEWIKIANRVMQLICVKDPNLFLRWQPIRDTMNATNSKFVIQELNYLTKHRLWKSIFKTMVQETWVGGQIPFILYPISSGNTIHLTYVISNFWDKTNKNFYDLDYIFEYGGGYGNLCRLIHKAGFNGKYVIFDMPVFSKLQKFYLKSSGLPVYNQTEILGKRKGIICVNSIDILKIILSETMQPKLNKNLFIATWSLSESPISYRDAIKQFLPSFGFFLIGYQDKFGEMDNIKYFAELKKKTNNIIWHDYPLKQLPGHNLLIGRNK